MAKLGRPLRLLSHEPRQLGRLLHPPSAGPLCRTVHWLLLFCRGPPPPGAAPAPAPGGSGLSSPLPAPRNGPSPTSLAPGRFWRIIYGRQLLSTPATAPAAPAPAPAPVRLPTGAAPVLPVANQHMMITRSKQSFQQLALFTTAPLSHISRSYCVCPCGPMEAEYSALLANYTWDLIPQPPRSNVVIGKWVFKHKFKANGTFECYKSRWVFMVSLNALVLTSPRPSVLL